VVLNSITTAPRERRAVREERADAITFGRPYISNPTSCSGWRRERSSPRRPRHLVQPGARRLCRLSADGAILPVSEAHGEGTVRRTVEGHRRHKPLHHRSGGPPPHRFATGRILGEPLLQLHHRNCRLGRFAALVLLVGLARVSAWASSPPSGCRCRWRSRPWSAP
jgi:hypothetical protein